ncbi:SDR family NAD(P)-dependent oxidoreductase [Caldilinea sp.]|uniref:SDR family NAD(P)-dependent oxidoreductase n=1 Tax=Caldilinea sp. TaxID=2293560 RepID=UPI002C309F49|nr:SDR family NAD(P)-dependent oxidoreductase [Caldilinea sp.]
MMEQGMMRAGVESARFAGQVVVITGAGGGIGGACALRFAQEQARIACLDIDAAGNAQTAERCRTLGVEAIALPCDVTDAAAVEATFAAVAARWGGIDMLVASAGIYTGAPLEELSTAQWLTTLHVNLTGAFYSNRAVASYLRERGGGSIINISSMAGKTSWPASAEYSASKSGLIGLTRSVAMELAPYGVTVNAICPGNTLTNMVAGVAARVGARDGLSADAWLQQRAKDCPLGRLAHPWEMAGVVAFLASQDARYLTGQALEVDGGMVMS